MDKVLWEMEEKGLALTLDSLDDVVGGTATPTSDHVFGALVASFKRGGKTKAELENFVRTSETVFNVKGMEGVTMEDAMSYIDSHW